MTDLAIRDGRSPDFGDLEWSDPFLLTCDGDPTAEIPALLSVLLFRYTGRPRISLAVVLDGRVRPVELAVEGGSPLKDLTATVRGQLDEACPGPPPAGTQPDAVVAFDAIEEPTAGILCNVHPAEGGCRIALASRASERMTPRAECSAPDMAACLAHLATQADTPSVTAGGMEMVPPGMRKRLLVEANGRRVDYAADETILSRFEARSAESPDLPAITFAETTLTYGMLDRKANALARRLEERGVTKGVLVPVLAGNGIELPLAMVALMKLGAPFVPMDEGWPRERIARLVENLAPPLVVRAGDGDALPPGTPVLAIDHAEVPEAASLHDGVAASGQDLIYGFFTSGSTGLPKCALNRHRGLLNRFLVMTRHFAADGSRPVVLQNSRHVFDSSIWQLLWPLTAGGRVVIPETRGLLDLTRTIATIERHGITMTDFVPSIFNALVELLHADPSQAARLASLRRLLIGGEEIDPRAVRRFRRLLPHVGITNTYGPTEASIGCIFHDVGDGDDETIPIGRPIDNTFAVIRAETGGPVPPGVVGEILIGGDCLGAGYLNEPEKTAAAFIDNPFPEIPGDRIYRTGDLGYYRRDGLLQFLGRIDNQVKIGGIRIELAEIETALAEHPAVRSARVVVVGTGEHRRLAACILSASAPGEAALRRHAEEKLPKYAVPARFLVLDKFPLNQNGKVDRKELAKIATAAMAPPQAGPLRLSGGIEETVVAVWREVGSLPAAAGTDNFFDLGGTSLLALTVTLALAERLGTRVTVQDLFSNQTVGALAALLDRRRNDPAPTAPIPAPIPAPVLAEDVRPGRPRSVLVTGATGFVGAHLVHELSRRGGLDLVCLVRSATPEEGRGRLADSLESYDLPMPTERLAVVSGDLADHRFGLAARDYSRLADGIDAVIHAGAAVNLLHCYSALEAANVRGSEEVLRFACHGRLKQVHHVSTLSVFPEAAGMIVDEGSDLRLFPPPGDGYSQSKRMAELLAGEAARRGVPVSIYRLGEMMPPAGTGAPNTRSLLEMLVHACLRLGLRFPTGLRFDYSPVDDACRFMAERLVAARPPGTFHLFGPGIGFEELLDAFARAGFALRPVSYAEFHRRLRIAFQESLSPRLGAVLSILPQPAGDALRDFEATGALAVDKDPAFDGTLTRTAMAEAGMAWKEPGGPGLGSYLAWHRRMLKEMPADPGAAALAR